MKNKDTVTQVFPFSKLPLIINENVSKSLEKMKEGILLMKRNINTINNPYAVTNSKFRPSSSLKINFERSNIKMKTIRLKRKLKINKSNGDTKYLIKEMPSPMISQETVLNTKSDNKEIRKSTISFEKDKSQENSYIKPIIDIKHSIKNKSSFLITELRQSNLPCKDLISHIPSRIREKSILLPKIDQETTSSNHLRYLSSNSVLESLSRESTFSPILDSLSSISPQFNKNILEVKDKLSRYYRLARSELNQSKDFENRIIKFKKGSVRKTLEELLRPLENEEILYLREEQKKINKPVFIYNKEKKRKKEMLSQNKNSLLEQTDFITNTNENAVYKFKNFIYEKFGKKDIYDISIDPVKINRNKSPNNREIDNHGKVIRLLKDNNRSHISIESHASLR